MSNRHGRPGRGGPPRIRQRERFNVLQRANLRSKLAAEPIFKIPTRFARDRARTSKPAPQPKSEPEKRDEICIEALSAQFLATSQR